MPAMAARPNLRKTIREYPLATGAAFLEGAVVVAAAGEVNEAAANPVDILGIALHDAGADPDTDVCLVALALDGATFVMQGVSAPVAADEGETYGISKDADGIWVIDKAKLAADHRVFVEKVYIDREEFEVRVLAANRQVSG